MRGIIRFRCDDCGKTFKAMDFEWMDTVYSQPMPCPHCGGWHTLPWHASLPLVGDRAAYREIWHYNDLSQIYDTKENENGRENEA